MNSLGETGAKVIDDCAVDLRSAMSILADDFIDHADVGAILTNVACLAVELIAGADFADVMLVEGHSYQTLAPTSERAIELDALQMDTGEGPCLTAATSDNLVCSADLGAETRWPRFAPAAVQAGVQAMMSLKLYAYPPSKSQERNRGALNIFSTDRHEFTAEERSIGALLATHASGSLIAAERECQLRVAIDTRDVIGQAKGMLMERFSIDSASAFTLLMKLSQQTNDPVRQIAERIVKTPR